jgi:hypothetical protein
MKTITEDVMSNRFIEGWPEIWSYLVGRACERDTEAQKLVTEISGQPWELSTPRGQVEARIRAGSIAPMDWEPWAAELDRLAGDSYGPTGAIKGCGAECWREHFNDGDSPAEAIQEDMDNLD